MTPILRLPVRLALSSFQALRRSWWYFKRPAVLGVQALVVTPDRRIVLVRHSYSRGWQMPGGGRKRGEAPQAAILRELAEEIGLRAHGEIRHLVDYQRVIDYREATISLFKVEEAQYRPRWSLEIEEIGAFDPARLPHDTTEYSRLYIERYCRASDGLSAPRQSG